jgi:succinate-semialdehyde dehydrogenase/glutarate-semialdehyde dehydrogenase
MQTEQGPDSTAVASLDLEDPSLLTDQCLVGGSWIPAHSGGTFPVYDPATGAVLAHVPNMGTAETNEAVTAAREALPAWRAAPAKERAAVLRRWYELIVGNAGDLALIMTSEQGKTLAEAKGEIAYAASFPEFFAEEAKRIYGDLIPAPTRDRRFLVLKEPVGVCAAITPWNFPSGIVTRKVSPALAAGCTIVVKPAEQTPLSALALAVLAERAGVPAGVLNVITGEPEAIGVEMTANPDVRKLSFTGSTEVGRLLMRASADTVKKLTLELGGNAPFIVFDDADLDAAVAGAMLSKFRNTGQTCVCANRIYVQSAVYEEFAERLAAATSNLKVGDGREPGIDQGPLIDQAALDKVVEHVEDARRLGAKVLVGGKPHSLGGTFYEPTVLAGATSDMLLARQETFGPVAPLFRFETEPEAIALANDTEYGLASYFFARDVGRVWRVSEALEYGMVGINTGFLSHEMAPFGGIKQSGVGREGSKYGLDEYLELKYLCLGGL